MLSEPFLHRDGDRRFVVDVSQVVFPRAIDMQVLDHIGHQLPQALARVIAGALVMHIAKDALDWVRVGTIRREKEQLKARLLGYPLLNGFGYMNPIVIRHWS
jgi:hypothetical protein